MVTQIRLESPHVTLWEGDCMEVLREMPDGSVDAVVCDPPYALDFMSSKWDNPQMLGQIAHGGSHTRGYKDNDPRLFQEWCAQWASECLRILKPGGHLLAFGASRTWHRLCAGIEDAGFDIRDSLAWLYGSGMPKGQNVERVLAQKGEPGATDWHGWSTTLKPAFEPIVVARKPLDGTVAHNVTVHGVGALNIDATRVPMSGADAATINAKHAGMDAATYQRPVGTALNLSAHPMPLKPAHAHELGRWPANVTLTHGPDCKAGACAEGCPVADLDAQSGISTSSGGRTVKRSNFIRKDAADTAREWTRDDPGFGDTGGASRFFHDDTWDPILYEAKAPRRERPEYTDEDGKLVRHVTVKPLALMRRLVRLVVPAGAVVLDPFAGSGTTVEACLLEGVRCIAIEREHTYIPLIVQRVQRCAA